MFLPRSHLHSAYLDNAVPIGYGQTISQPSLVCKMIDLLELKRTDNVLEIGTGFGYNAALISKLAREVVTIDIIHKLVDKARLLYNFLIKNGVLPNNLTVLHGDGSNGYKHKAPYDKIIVTCGAFNKVPAKLLKQLNSNGGILVVPIKNKHPSGNEYLYRYIKNGDDIKEEEIFAVRFVNLVKNHLQKTLEIVSK